MKKWSKANNTCIECGVFVTKQLVDNIANLYSIQGEMSYTFKKQRQELTSSLSTLYRIQERKEN